MLDFLQWILEINYELNIQGTHDQVLFWLVAGMTIQVRRKNKIFLNRFRWSKIVSESLKLSYIVLDYLR